MPPGVGLTGRIPSLIHPPDAWGILMRIMPADLSLSIEVQRAPDNGAGLPNTGAAVTISIFPCSSATTVPSAGPTGASRVFLYPDLRANDGARWHYRVRHVSPSMATAGAWSIWGNGVPYLLTWEQQHLRTSDPDPLDIDPLTIPTGGTVPLIATADFSPRNPDFDIWATSSQPDSWDCTDGDVTIAKETVNVYSGVAALKLTNPNNATNGGWHGVNSGYTLRLRPGRRYRILVASRCSLAGCAYRLVAYFNAGGSLTDSKTFYYGQLDAYQVNEWVVSVPTNAEALQNLYVQVSRNGSGSAANFLVDSLYIVEEEALSGARNVGSQCVLNPELRDGATTGYSVYDNNATGRISLSNVADATASNGSGRILRVSWTAAAGAPAPGMGGWFIGIGPDSGATPASVHQPGFYHKGGEIIWRIIAKIPTGFSLQWATNAYGTEGTFEWITSQAGTGAYETYLARQRIGTSGSFSTTGFWYLLKDDGSNVTGTITVDVALVDGVDISQPEQVGPQLHLWAVQSSTDYTIYYVVDADSFLYRTDNGAESAVPASGFTASRNARGGADKNLSFRALKSGQEKPERLSVLPIGQRFRARVSLVSNQTLSASGASDKILFDAEDYDVGGLHSTVSNKSRITIPTGGDGLWVINAQVFLLTVSNTAWTDAFMSILVNNSPAINSPTDYRDVFASPTNGPTLRCTAYLYLTAGDYVEITAGADWAAGGTPDIAFTKAFFEAIHFPDSH